MWKPWPSRLSLYGLCPPGAWPAGFWFSDSCVCPPPLQLGCWPPAWLPPLLVHAVSTSAILAKATPLNAIVSAMTSAANSNVTRFLIRVFLLSLGRPLPLCLGTALSTVPPEELVECLFAGAGRSCKDVHSQNKRPALASTGNLLLSNPCASPPFLHVPKQTQKRLSPLIWR
jgi:hypothetical protein